MSAVPAVQPIVTFWTRPRIFNLSRSIIVVLVLLSMGSLFVHPQTWWQHAIDIALRTYIMFLGTVMAHEGTHGNLGRTKSANSWWGRLALLPTMVPYTNFRRTHNLHHAFTNDPEKDPDYFLATRHKWQIPLRAVAMPHSWLFWLRRKERLRHRDLADLALNYVGIFLVYGVVLYFVGWQRLVIGMLPSLVLVSILLWYPFAIKTHEGYSMGSAESRSHDYHGALMFWFSLGLSMHRVHHIKPGLTWFELRPYVEPVPGPWWRQLLPQRDIRPDEPAH